MPRLRFGWQVDANKGVAAVIGGPIGSPIGGVLVVHTPADLRTALAQHEKQIVIEDKVLALKAQIIIALAGLGVLGIVAHAVLLGALDRNYKIEVGWKVMKAEGKVILTPTK